MQNKTIEVVFFEDFSYAAEFMFETGGFQKVSYGDAEYTLCEGGILADEVVSFIEDPTSLQGATFLQLAIELIDATAKGSLVALKG